jgi:RNA polymerase sigma-70 factor (ECF subfamily)
MPAYDHATTRSGAGPSDAALVVEARAGAEWASEALFRRHAPAINGLVYRLVGRDVDLDDLVQETFAQAFTSLHRLQAPASFASWLAGIAVRTTYKMLRRRRLLTRLGLRRSEPVDPDTVVSRDAPPDVAADLRRVYAVVGALAPKLRVALVLRRVEGASLEEIAELTGASLATVKRRIAEADRVLASTLGIDTLGIERSTT